MPVGAGSIAPTPAGRPDPQKSHDHCQQKPLSPFQPYSPLSLEMYQIHEALSSLCPQESLFCHGCGRTPCDVWTSCTCWKLCLFLCYRSMSKALIDRHTCVYFCVFTKTQMKVYEVCKCMSIHSYTSLYHTRILFIKRVYEIVS